MRNPKPTAESVLLRIAAKLEVYREDADAIQTCAGDLRLLAAAFAGLRKAVSNPLRDAAVKLAQLGEDCEKFQNGDGCIGKPPCPHWPDCPQKRKLLRRLILKLAGVKGAK
jgi:hypothetical protein